jgi:hypothetical protein
MKELKVMWILQCVSLLFGPLSDWVAKFSRRKIQNSTSWRFFLRGHKDETVLMLGDRKSLGPWEGTE